MENKIIKNEKEINYPDNIIDDIEDIDLCNKEGNLDNWDSEEDPYNANAPDSGGR